VAFGKHLEATSFAPRTMSKVSFFSFALAVPVAMLAARIATSALVPMGRDVFIALTPIGKTCSSVRESELVCTVPICARSHSHENETDCRGRTDAGGVMNRPVACRIGRE